jgi:hypothetical protein
MDGRGDLPETSPMFNVADNVADREETLCSPSIHATLDRHPLRQR